MQTTNDEVSSVTVWYLVIAIVVLAGLAFLWRELPAGIRYLKIKRM